MSEPRRKFAFRIALLSLAVVTLTTGPGAGSASADVYSDLASSQAEQTSAKVQLASAQRKLQRKQAVAARVANRYKAASLRADEAQARVASEEKQLAADRLEARETVDKMIADYSDDKDEHDTRKALAIGVGIAFLLLALLTCLFSKVSALERLKDYTRPGASRKIPSIALGFVLLAGLVFLSLGGVAAGIGAFLVVLGIGLVTFFLVLIHQAKSDEATPADEGDRKRRWLVPAIATFLFLLFAGTVGTGVLAAEPEKPSPSAELLSEAEAAADDPADPPNEAVRAATVAAIVPVRKARTLRKAEIAAYSAARSARRATRASSRRVRRAGRAVRRNSRRVARAEAVARRQAARQAAAAAAAAEAAAEEAAAAASTPSYSSCATAPSNIPVPPGSDLDADGDGIGCED